MCIYILKTDNEHFCARILDAQLMQILLRGQFVLSDRSLQHHSDIQTV